MVCSIPVRPELEKAGVVGVRGGTELVGGDSEARRSPASSPEAGGARIRGRKF